MRYDLCKIGGGREMLGSMMDESRIEIESVGMFFANTWTMIRLIRRKRSGFDYPLIVCAYLTGREGRSGGMPIFN